MRAALELDDRYLGALAVAHHGGEHLATLQGGLADFHLRAFPNQQHFAELDGGTRLGVELLDAQDGVLRHPILLAARGDDRVHGSRGGMGLEPKGRAFYWRPPSRSNGAFPRRNGHLALNLRPPRTGGGHFSKAAPVSYDA